ncbi:MAG: AsmA-like C-terminal region-containing protein [Cyclobacteriaceae bacterium]
MKKFLIIFFAIFLVLLIAAIAVPIIFKDRIRDEISKTLDETIDANIHFSRENFSFSLLRHFPNPTASLSQFGITGKGEFAGDTLLAVNDFEIVIGLFSLFGDNPTIKSIYLKEPFINIKVLKDGKANYDIVKDDGEEEAAEEESSDELRVGIDKWVISNGRIIYNDKTLDYYMDLKGVNHEGRGDFTLNVFDMVTINDIAEVIVSYEGVKYLNKQRISGDITLNMDLEAFKFTFKDNFIQVNDFPVSFDGYIAMPAEDIEMDITFASINSSIKSLYSLVPGVYTEGYDGVKADGTMSFSGFAKGIYSETTMPAFSLKLLAENGYIQYPDLPEAIRNIEIDMLVDNADGNIDNTLIDVRKFKMEFGKNPIDARLLVKNLVNYDMDAQVVATLNLEELSTLFPMDGLAMRGMFTMDVSAVGVYDSIRNVMPAVDAKASLKNGYVKSAEFPKALENMAFNASFLCPSGKMEDGVLKVNDFIVKMAADEFSANLLLSNLVDYTWDLSMKGGLDLGVVSELFPLEGMKYSGNAKADVNTQGKYSDVEAERFDRFPTEGNIEVTDFSFVSEDLPQGMNMPVAKVSFDPRSMRIENLNAKVGSSDFAVQGAISNYIDYIFKDNALLKGNMSLVSNILDLNEFMTGEPTPDEADTTKLELLEIPKNVDFEFNANIAQINYDNLKLKNAKGTLIVRDGRIHMDGLNFGLLGGAITMNGTYDTHNPADPLFDFDMNIRALSIPDAFTSFTTVQAFAPFAQHMNGDFNTKFKMNGKLGQDMMPKLETLTGGGIIEIADAYLKQSKLVDGLTSITKMSASSSDMQLKDILLNASIKNGRASVRPFDLTIANQKATIDGSVGLDGSLNYNLNTEVPAGVAGQAVGNLLAGLTGNQSLSGDTKLKFNIGIGGTYSDPKFSLVSVSTEDGKTVTQDVKEDVKQEIRDEVDRRRDEAEDKAREEVDKAMDKAEEKLQPKVDSAKLLLEERAKEQQEQLEKETDKAKDKLKDLFRRGGN